MIGYGKSSFVLLTSELASYSEEKDTRKIEKWGEQPSAYWGGRTPLRKPFDRKPTFRVPDVSLELCRGAVVG